MSLEQVIPKRWALAAAVIVALLLVSTAWPIHSFAVLLIAVALRLALIAILGYHLNSVHYVPSYGEFLAPSRQAAHPNARLRVPTADAARASAASRTHCDTLTSLGAAPASKGPISELRRATFDERRCTTLDV